MVKELTEVFEASIEYNDRSNKGRYKQEVAWRRKQNKRKQNKNKQLFIQI
jgi:hypothetical protein